MKTRLFASFMLIAAFLTGPTCARSGVPIVNYENVTIVTGSGKPLTLEQVKEHIIIAGAVHNWQISASEDGKLTARLLVRNKHAITVDLPYTTTQYSMIYKDSMNMNYEVSHGVPEIHPSYNKWVDTLGKDIRTELLKL